MADANQQEPSGLAAQTFKGENLLSGCCPDKVALKGVASWQAGCGASNLHGPAVDSRAGARNIHAAVLTCCRTRQRAGNLSSSLREFLLAKGRSSSPHEHFIY